MSIRHIDHVQLAMPAGREDDAVRFSAGLLGVPQVPKPPHLAVRGGCWFERGDLVDDLARLIADLTAGGIRVTDDEPGSNAATTASRRTNRQRLPTRCCG